MNTQSLLMTIIYCASTTEDALQNARNALVKLQDMRKAIGWSFALYKAIRRQKKVIENMEKTYGIS
jgi:hypothetical protein